MWFLIAALIMGVAVQKSGLLQRVSLLVLKVFPATFKGQTFALLTAGTIIAPFIPSVTAKSVIMAPLSKGISEAMGFPQKSRGASGLFGAFWIGFVCTGVSFLSASLFNYLIKGMVPKEVAAQFTWMQWFLAALPWTIVLFIASFIALQLLYKPKEKATLPPGYATEELKKLGPWKREEKIVLVVMCLALVCWMLERTLNIPAVIVALLAVCIFVLTNVLTIPDLRAKVPWDMMIFYGGLLGIAIVFPSLKIDKWLGGLVTPYIAPLVSNPYLFIAALAICIYIVRTAIISLTATLTLFMLMIIPVASAAGYNPWVIGIVTYASMWVWHLLYQNGLYIPAFYAVEGLVEQKQMAKLSVAYMIISILGFWACIPVWQFMGLIK